MDADKVRGTGWAREFVPESMRGDICEHPERNARSDSWDNNGYFRDDGIIINSNSNPGSPLNDSGSLNLPVEVNLDSSSCSGEASPNTDANSGSIFGWLFNFFGFGGCETNILSNPYPSSSVDDGGKIR